MGCLGLGIRYYNELDFDASSVVVDTTAVEVGRRGAPSGLKKLGSEGLEKLYSSPNMLLDEFVGNKRMDAYENKHCCCCIDRTDL